MLPDKRLSFTATLSSRNHPLIVLGEWTRGPVIAAHPTSDPVRPALLDAASALGTLDGPPSAFAHEQELGLIDFNVIEGIEPLSLYFRHSNGAYRLYLRNGAHVGEGVFNTPEGLLVSSAIGRLDPPRWALHDANNGNAFNLFHMAGDAVEVKLSTADNGMGVSLHGLSSVAGYLAKNPAAPSTPMTLTIVEREVDWLSAI